MKDSLKHPSDGSARHMPHLAKVHKAVSKGLVTTPIIKIAGKSGSKPSKG